MRPLSIVAVFIFGFMMLMAETSPWWIRGVGGIMLTACMVMWEWRHQKELDREVEKDRIAKRVLPSQSRDSGHPY